MSEQPQNSHSEEDLSLAQAAERYQVSIRTLGQRVRLGEIAAHKNRGPWGQEWRIKPKAMEAFGYHPPTADTSAEPSQIADPSRLMATVDALTRAVAAERNRADQANKRLAEALDELTALGAERARERRDVIDLDAVHSPREKGDQPARRLLDLTQEPAARPEPE